MTPKILIVDDDPDIRKMFSSILIKSGYQVWVSESVTKAQEFLTGEILPDLIVLDLYFPGESGLDIIETIKSNPNFNRVKIMVVSANTQLLWSWEKTSGYHPDFAVLKPIGLRELSLLIKQQLQDWRPNSQSKRETTEEMPRVVLDNGIHAYWGDASKKSIIVKYPVNWDWEEYALLRQEHIFPMMDSVSHPISVIHDFLEANVVPPNTLLKIRQFANSTHSNFSGLMVVVGGTTFLRRLFDFANRNYLDAIRTVFTDSLEDALLITETITRS